MLRAQTNDFQLKFITDWNSSTERQSLEYIWRTEYGIILLIKYIQLFDINNLKVFKYMLK